MRKEGREGGRMSEREGEWIKRGKRTAKPVHKAVYLPYDLLSHF